MAKTSAARSNPKSVAPTARPVPLGRPRGVDHDLKRQAILKKAAELFAESGYASASVADLATACGTSKALLYHYYANKEQLLFDILHEHFSHLLSAVRAAKNEKLNQEDQLRALIAGLLDAYAGGDATHKVQIHDMAKLPSTRQKELKEMERAIVAAFSDALAAINPKLKLNKRLLKPVTMSLFGMLNWQYLWFRPTGELTRSDYANLVGDIIIAGARRVA